MRIGPVFLLILLLLATPVYAKAKKVNDYHWTGVHRVVAIGDLHGDYEQYIQVMRSADLLDKKGRWSGGSTHLVQTGDITDRGPDSRKIIDHLVKLAKQAKRKGGYVHMLIGNHEAMNVVGDLRYVSGGEYEAFMTRNSKLYQEKQWEQQVNWMRANMLTFEELDLVAYRAEWEQQVPLGWVEHRQGWSLMGDYGSWVKDNPVAVKINDTIYLHGGISAEYCKFSLESLTEQVITAMENFDPAEDSIIFDPQGPIWYRGMATEDEEGVFSETLDNILKRYAARRVVIGHTPTGGVVWPRFDQRVVANDTGIGSHYGSHIGILELSSGNATAIYGGQRIPLPVRNSEREGYLRAVIEADSNNAQLKQRLASMLAPDAEASSELADVPQDELPADIDAVLIEPVPGTCQ
jgi:hypothetical protein